MTTNIDQDAREAREWAEYITSVLELHGTYAPQARAAARFILDNTTPDLLLPDPLFLAKATHPERGEGVVGSYHPTSDRAVRFMFPDQETVDGTNSRWVPLSTLTFHTQETPEFLEAEEDYRSAPEGTIVAEDDAVAVVLLLDGLWGYVDTYRSDHEGMAGIRRRVLRWGWEA